MVLSHVCDASSLRSTCDWQEGREIEGEAREAGGMLLTRAGQGWSEAGREGVARGDACRSGRFVESVVDGKGYDREGQDVKV